MTMPRQSDKIKGDYFMSLRILISFFFLRSVIDFSHCGWWKRNMISLLLLSLKKAKGEKKILHNSFHAYCIIDGCNCWKIPWDFSQVTTSRALMESAAMAEEIKFISTGYLWLAMSRLLLINYRSPFTLVGKIWKAERRNDNTWLDITLSERLTM